MALKVLIVDDDQITGGLSRDLLTDGDCEADLITESVNALEQIRKNRYPVVVLDILMPGIDGLTLCHQIKSDPELKTTRVVMVSGKSFEAEKKRAEQYGADLFIEKPYNVETFAQQIKDLAASVEPPRSAAPAEEPAPAGKAPAITPGDVTSAAEPVLQVSIWGTRSSADPSSKSSYGRHSPCVSVDLGDTLLAFDGGSGLVPLGETIVKNGKPSELWVFLTHFHPEHVEGLPSFAPAKSEAFTIHIGGTHEPNKPLEALVQGALAKAASIKAQIDLYDMLEESYEIKPGVTLTSYYANHPGATLGFLLQAQGRKFAYCPDSELYGEWATSMQDFDEKLGKLCAGADLMIMDARYTVEDYLTRRNQGHSAFTSTLDFAGRNGIQRLLLFHQDARYTDQELSKMEEEAKKLLAERGYALQCAVAREGITVGV